MKILIVDGQGGKMGKTIVEQLKLNFPQLELASLTANK